MELCRGHSNTKCALFSITLKDLKEMAQSIIFGDRNSRQLFSFNGKFLIQGAVSNNNLALWWCQWLLQVQFTFIFEKILEVDVH